MFGALLKYKVGHWHFSTRMAQFQFWKTICRSLQEDRQVLQRVPWALEDEDHPPKGDFNLSSTCCDHKAMVDSDAVYFLFIGPGALETSSLVNTRTKIHSAVPLSRQSLKQIHSVGGTSRFLRPRARPPWPHGCKWLLLDLLSESDTNSDCSNVEYPPFPPKYLIRSKNNSLKLLEWWNIPHGARTDDSYTAVIAQLFS